MEQTIEQETHTMTMWLCLDRLKSKTQGGLGSFIHPDKLDDVIELYMYLTKRIQEIANDHALALRATREEEKKKKEDTQ